MEGGKYQNLAPPPVDQMTGNALLAKLRDDDQRRLSAHMSALELKAGHILQRAGEDVTHTWFPCGASLAAFRIWVDDINKGIEVALVGREGAIGGIVSNGSLPAYATSEVLTSGRFLRIKTSALEHAKLQSVALRHWFSRYSDCLLAQVFQTAACNAGHTITQRTAKWLLAAVSRTSGTEFEMTHEQLADMLGVGRTFVTRIVRHLRTEGLIATRRGRFIVIDEAGLRARSCGCTTAIQDHFETVLHGIYPIE